MALQNRVTPFGEVVADPARGLFMGNRGCLCDEAGVLAKRRWRMKAWITCRLSYKGWWRPVMRPKVWTELFFLDEATALAAGHRPCALCRRQDYNRYRLAWAKALGLSKPPLAVEMDAQLHRERTRRDRSKITFWAKSEDLPDGCMVALGEPERRPALIHDGRMLLWSPGGYSPGPKIGAGRRPVLTPRATVAVLAAGYRPVLHASGSGG